MLAAEAAQETQIKGIGAVPPDALDAAVDAPDAIDVATDLDAASAKGGEELVACMHRVFGQAMGSCMGPLVRAQVERWLAERGITPAVARAAYERALRSRLVP
jgi:hypothetical protein